MTLPIDVSNLFQTRRDRGRWANPKQSIGEIIRFDALKKPYICWRAIGVARGLFDDELGPAIEAYLKRCHSEDRSVVFITFCMIGKTKETAAPKIIFSCTNKVVRRQLRKLVESSSIMAAEKYAGIGLGESSVPPEHHRPRLLAGGGPSAESIGSIHLEPGHSTITILSRAPKIAFGDRILISRGSTVSDTLRRATAGPILYFQDKAYCLTVAHVFFDNHGYNSGHDSDVSIPQDCDFDGMSDSDIEIDPAEEQEIMSRGSLTSEEDTPDTENLSSNSSVRTSSTPGSAAGVRSLPRQIPSFPSISIPNETRSQVKDSPADDSLSVIADTLTTSNPVLDYALIDVTGKIKPSANVIYISPIKTRQLSRTTAASIIGLDTFEVYTVTASSGLLTGKLHLSHSYIRLPNSMSFQKVYTVYLNGRVTDGDCGSWIFDKGGGLWGHIIAGTPGTGVALIVPADDVFANLWNRLQWLEASSLQGFDDIFMSTPGTATPSNHDASLTTVSDDTSLSLFSARVASLYTSIWPKEGRSTDESYVNDYSNASLHAWRSYPVLRHVSLPPSEAEWTSAVTDMVEILAFEAALQEPNPVTKTVTGVTKFTRGLRNIFGAYISELMFVATIAGRRAVLPHLLQQADTIANLIRESYTVKAANIMANTVQARVIARKKVARLLELDGAMSLVQASESEYRNLEGEDDRRLLQSWSKWFLISGPAFKHLRGNLREFMRNFYDTPGPEAIPNQDSITLLRLGNNIDQRLSQDKPILGSSYVDSAIDSGYGSYSTSTDNSSLSAQSRKRDSIALERDRARSVLKSGGPVEHRLGKQMQIEEEDSGNELTGEEMPVESVGDLGEAPRKSKAKELRDSSKVSSLATSQSPVMQLPVESPPLSPVHSDYNDVADHSFGLPTSSDEAGNIRDLMKVGGESPLPEPSRRDIIRFRMAMLE
jgi:hypothetical protein